MKMLGFVAAVISAVISTASFAQDVRVGRDTHLEHGWDFYTSHTECGGLTRDGKPQALCSPKYATYEGPAVGSCPAGQIFDIGLWSCWSCPAGFSRTGAAVDTDRACQRQATSSEIAAKPRFRTANFLGTLCPAGSFYDSIRGGECWACPPGYNVNVLVHVEQFNKCTRPAQESFQRINRHNRATGFFGTDCPSGQFWDPIDGFCYSCPSGYSRTGYSVRDGRACVTVTAVDHKPARVTGIGKCAAGAITDPRNNGECWKCPEGYDRVLLKPINDSQACETTPNLVFARAKNEGPVTCAAGQHFDFVKVDRSRLSQLQNAGLAKSGARAAPDGGTCWSCPANHKRTILPVWEQGACKGELTEWYSKPFSEPGLFGLAGADDVIVEILRHDRVKVEKAIQEAVKACAEQDYDTKAATKCKSNKEESIAGYWDEIQNRPWASGILMAMALSRVQLAATESRQPLPADTRAVTAADRQLARSFAEYVGKRRVFIAEEALKAYDAWKKADAYWQAWFAKQKQLANTAVMKDTDLTRMRPQEEPVPPPDFHEIVQTAAIASAAGLTVVAGGTVALAAAVPSFRNAIFPSIKIRSDMKARIAALIKKEISEAVDDVAGEAGKKLGRETTKKALTEGTKKAVLKISGSALKGAGAAAAAFVVGTVISVAIEVAMKMDEHSRTDRKHIEAVLAQAKQPVNLTGDFLTDEGSELLTGYWVLAMTTGTPPQALKAGEIKKLATATPATASAAASASEAKAAAAVTTGNWDRVSGEATAVAVGAKGGIWVLGANKVPGGYGLHRWDNNKWTPVPGGAVRIAVDPAGNPWAVNDQNQIFRNDGRRWIGMPGAATDIAIGANGTVWVLGTNKVPGGFGLHRLDNNNWVGFSGGAVRIAVDPVGNPWVVNDRNEIFRWDGNQWISVPGRAQAIGIGANGAIWVVGIQKVAGGFEVYAWNNTNWQKVPGGLTEIAVAPDGRPVGVNQQAAIFFMK